MSLLQRGAASLTGAVFVGLAAYGLVERLPALPTTAFLVLGSMFYCVGVFGWMPPGWRRAT